MKIGQVLSISAALLLGGCFISAEDLIKPADADYPIADGTRLVLHELDETGARTGATEEETRITRDGDLYLMTTGEDGKIFAGLMKEIAPDLYAVQAREADSPEGNLYALVERDGANWRRWSMICPDFVSMAEEKGVALSEMGVTLDSSDCVVEDFASLKTALMFAYENGKPDAEYVAE
ncbi:hypothetical protein Plav_1437 [Parvibaculum lavamentivorans DS-1]|uniref:Lipoprotein n=1 Tax=Parvibaculum lavamentivorans (strain DS-1 / DSM 13023 / NCIMB 13966) TaxID=402881 RepID=A7HT24_PARL1|nr:hypothetical protein [Parvibaculum lavamentivorans]ABS63057.1 hypothetical protein Plav_1437 [Parvibaculum lavamentivorans DS-1]